MLFLAAYVLSGVAPLLHHHNIAIRLTPDERVSAHTCGDVEHHIPLEAVHGCYTCWQSSQRESTPVESVSTGYIVVVAGIIPELRSADSHSTCRLLPDKRGPPVVA